MFPSLDEVLKFLDIENKEEKIYKLLGFILDFWMAAIFYKKFNGTLVLVKDLDAKKIVEFITHPNFFIPVLFFLLIWYLFHRVIRGFINVIIWFLFGITYIKKIAPLVKKNETEAIKGVSFLLHIAIALLPIHAGRLEEDLTEESQLEIEDSISESGDDIKNNVEIRLDRIIIYIQLLIIYYGCLQGVDIFVGIVNVTLKVLLWTSIFVNILIVFTQYVFIKMLGLFKKGVIKFIIEHKANV